MKTFLFLCATLITITSVHAAELWQYNIGTNFCVQLVADGAGGCAISTMSVHSNYTGVTWLDAKGMVLFKTNFFIESTIPTAILSFNKKQLAFCYLDGGLAAYQVMQVTKDSCTRVSTNAAAYYILPSAFPNNDFYGMMNVWQDKKGYFAQKQDPGTGSMFIVRFSAKP